MSLCGYKRFRVHVVLVRQVLELVGDGARGAFWHSQKVLSLKACGALALGVLGAVFGLAKCIYQAHHGGPLILGHGLHQLHHLGAWVLIAV